MNAVGIIIALAVLAIFVGTVVYWLVVYHWERRRWLDERRPR